MRISDWSSDVCSSDLRKFRAEGDMRPDGALQEVGHAGDEVLQAPRLDLEVLAAREGEQALGQRRTPPRPLQRTVDQPRGLGVVRKVLAQQLAEIGRASCRERGCQYV